MFRLSFVRGRAGLVVALVLAAAIAGCGRKLPPIQPGSYPPPAVKDLVYQVRDEEVVLTWSIPAATSEKESPAAGFKVLRSRQTEAEAECTTCPPKFQAISDVRSPGPVTTAAMHYADRLEPGYRYQYKVRGYSAGGREGRDSNVVHLSR
jgi:hypothetical protein